MTAEQSWDNLRMSEEDVSRAKLQVHEDYIKCRVDLSALRHKARNAADLLDKVSTWLRAGGKDRFASGGLEEVLDVELIKLMNSLRETSERYELLSKTLSDMGLPVKD